MIIAPPFERGQPALGVGADIGPEQGVIVDVVIVAGQHIGAHFGQRVIVADQQEAAHVAARGHGAAA